MTSFPARLMILASVAIPAAQQELLQIGVAPADTETFAVEASVAVTTKAKTGPSLDFRSDFRILYTAKKTGTGATLQGRFTRFTFAGSAGEPALDIRWTQGQKLEEAAWGAAAGLRKLVAEGFTIELDRAGNPVLCSSGTARLLVMAFDPLLSGAATWFDGGVRAIGDRWTSSFQNSEAVVSCDNVYDKNEGGAAVITSTFTLKDRRTQEALGGGGGARTEIDAATGRPRGCTITIDLPASKDHPVHVEAKASVTPGKP